jgi:hypothetical protein
MLLLNFLNPTSTSFLVAVPSTEGWREHIPIDHKSEPLRARDISAYHRYHREDRLAGLNFSEELLALMRVDND